MPQLHISKNPKMTQFVIESDCFKDQMFLIVDIGASGGVEGHWNVLGNCVRHIAFEPNEDECKKLGEGNRNKNITYYPCALAGKTGKRKFYVRANGAACSFYKSSCYGDSWRYFHPDFVKQLVEEREVELEVFSFDDFRKGNNIGCPDFIKIDVEGAEMEIIEGAANILDDGVFGLCVEVHFDEATAPNRNGVFWAIDRFLQERGFWLFDLDLWRYSRIVLPQPYVYDYRDSSGKPCPGPTISGKPKLGDALYLRDAVYDLQHGGRKFSVYEILKMCCIYEMYGFNDYAAELLIVTRSVLEGTVNVEMLLDLLTPEVKGKRYPYKEHLESFIKEPGRFRPKMGKKFPGADMLDCDGTFVPSWKK